MARARLLPALAAALVAVALLAGCAPARPGRGGSGLFGDGPAETYRRNMQ